MDWWLEGGRGPKRLLRAFLGALGRRGEWDRSKNHEELTKEGLKMLDGYTASSYTKAGVVDQDYPK